MSERLFNEVEIFLAEVEAMKDIHTTDDNGRIHFNKNYVKLYSITVPKTNWIVQVDPKTNTPYYCNYVTKETTWNIPDEYRAYLTKYELYLKSQQEGTTKPKENKEKSKSPSPKHIFPEGNARKRRRIKRAFMRSNADKGKSLTNDGPIEFLSEYVSCYSSSCSSRSVSDSESSETQKSPLIEDHAEEQMDTEQNESEAFIGPLLPSVKPVECDSFLEFDNPETQTLCSPKLVSVNRSTLLEASQLLIEKFTAIDTQLDKFSPLQVAYVQFATRYEDWKYGYLPNERYFEKLEEVNEFLLQYEKTSLPQGTTWDAENKRYASKTDESDDNGFNFSHDQTCVIERDPKNQSGKIEEETQIDDEDITD